MKSTLILTAISLLTAAAHGSVVKVQSTGRVTGSVQNPSGTASVSLVRAAPLALPWLREHAYHYLFDRVRPGQTELEWRATEHDLVRHLVRHLVGHLVRLAHRHAPRVDIYAQGDVYYWWVPYPPEEVELSRSNTYDSVFVSSPFSNVRVTC
ncbi:hypothetical protein EDB89DRAFT_1907699 [Lactarius sanguifluus]|nr:hypothetical protein EDB89DRAFT_1907699 [Lactarius sanguifluus]